MAVVLVALLVKLTSFIALLHSLIGLITLIAFIDQISFALHQTPPYFRFETTEGLVTENFKPFCGN